MVPWITAAAVLVLDQFTKLLILRSFAPSQSVPLLPPVLHVTYVQNTGAAFGMFQGRPWAFAIIAVGIIIWIARELRHGGVPPKLGAAYGMVLGGAAGNLVDRLRFGYVVDFIDFRVWPVFNIADSAITIGVTLLIIHAFSGTQRHVTRDR